ncbi:MAG: cell division ATP-binding protein FtsE [Lachnospiraceae bacterium]|nr:cell division ATP-binding protein FtsE [Lachnospiraceae bacterium]
MIEFVNVSKTYETGNRAVKDINLRIHDGEFVFFTGRSGSGKSTLIKLITRELKPTEGDVIVSGWNLSSIRQRDIPRFRRNIGVVFQDFRLLNDRNVYENIAFAQRVIGASKREIRENVTEMLKLTGLSAKYKNMPYQLSGGEQQRVAIARALINRPSVILADEPTGNLDEKNSIEIMNLLLDINEMGTTVVVITHSRELVESVDKRVIVMEKGSVIRDTNGEDMRRPISAFFSDYRPTGRSRRERSVRVQEEVYRPEEKAVSELHPEYNANDAADLIDTDEVPWEAEEPAANGRSAGV